MGMTNREKFREVYGFDVDCGKCNPYPCEEDDCDGGNSARIIQGAPVRIGGTWNIRHQPESEETWTEKNIQKISLIETDMKKGAKKE